MAILLFQMTEDIEIKDEKQKIIRNLSVFHVFAGRDERATRTDGMANCGQTDGQKAEGLGKGKMAGLAPQWY
jgi:hypothetical protein